MCFRRAQDRRQSGAEPFTHGGCSESCRSRAARACACGGEGARAPESGGFVRKELDVQVPAESSRPARVPSSPPAPGIGQKAMAMLEGQPGGQKESKDTSCPPRGLADGLQRGAPRPPEKLRPQGHLYRALPRTDCGRDRSPLGARLPSPPSAQIPKLQLLRPGSHRPRPSHRGCGLPLSLQVTDAQASWSVLSSGFLTPDP